MRRSQDGYLCAIAAKVVTDFRGRGPLISDFFTHLDSQFTMSATKTVKELQFLGCAIHVGEDDSAEIRMHVYLVRVCTVQVMRERRSSPKLRADDFERAEYRSLAGVLLCLGQAVFHRRFQ